MSYEITIYAMMEDSERNYTLSDSPENTKFYDVVVTDHDGEFVKEFENLETYAEASKVASEAAALYPDYAILDVGG